MGIRGLLIAIYTCSALLGFAQVRADDGPFSGRQLREKCQAENKNGVYPINGYCWTTVNDAMGKIIISTAGEGSLCMPNDSTSQQLIATVTDYLDRNNQQLNEPAIDLSEASRHPKTQDADMFDESQVDYIKMGRMTLEFGGK